MAELGITTDLVIDIKTKDYQDSLEPSEEDSEEVKEDKKQKKEKFKKEIKEACEKAIQQKIDEAEALYQSIKTTCKNTISNAAIWSVQIPAISVPDPTAPKAGAASMAALKTSIAIAKANVTEASSKLTLLTGIIEGFGIPLPAPVSQISSLISQANSAINAIPL